MLKRNYQKIQGGLQIFVEGIFYDGGPKRVVYSGIVKAFRGFIEEYFSYKL